ncbi:hypothetical protein [Oceanivirga salmonicida]|uniref:hypothetical protein n=1 Tax=Oceanivirga salmonicida TaxID=1769291 RepID=UPI0008345A2E|nr:hypothetical protein [Oceanivirga salmonicida]
MEEKFTGRAIIREYDDILEIKIPSRKKIFEIIFILFLVILWLIVEIFALSSFFSNSYSDLFAKNSISVKLPSWTVGGVFIIYISIYKLFGYELITVENGNLKISKKAGLINRKREYKIIEIKNMAIIQNTLPYNDEDFIPFENQKIKFDYGMKTIKFASDIDEAEAKMILEKLKRNHNFREFNFKIVTSY